MSLRWFVASCKPRCEALAAGELRNQAFEVLLPLEKVVRPRRRQEPVRPFFGAHLLVRFDAEEPGWGAIEGTRGVRRLLRGASPGPSPLPERVASALVAKFSAGAVDPDEAVAAMKVGASVRVLEGPFEGWTGLCQRSTRDRVFVLLSWLGRGVTAEFEPNQVEVAA